MADNWIAGAVRNKGGLHRSLGVPQAKTIDHDALLRALSGKIGPKAAKQAQLAQTLKGFHKG